MTIKSWVVLDPVPGVDGESLLHLHEAAALDGTRVNPGCGFCDLVPPRVLPEVEVPRSGVHVVDLHGVEMVKGNERISEVASRWVDERSVNCCACSDLIVDRHGHRVAAVVVNGVLEECSSNQVERRANWDRWGCASDCWGCGHLCRSENRRTSLKSWTLNLLWKLLLRLRLRLRVDGSHYCLLEGSKIGLLLLLHGHDVGLLLLLKLLLE